MLTLAVTLLLAITSVPAIALSRSWWVVATYALLLGLCQLSPALALFGASGLLAAFVLVWAAGGSLR